MHLLTLYMIPTTDATYFTKKCIALNSFFTVANKIAPFQLLKTSDRCVSHSLRRNYCSPMIAFPTMSIKLHALQQIPINAITTIDANCAKLTYDSTKQKDLNQ